MVEQWKWPTVKQVKAAAEELKGMIRAKYPDAQFNLTRAPDDRNIWFLWTLVDVDDPDEVKALTSDRLDEMLDQDHILLHVRPTYDRRDVYGYETKALKKTG
jgi:hypothetical protein